jgi:hypothetical protein
MHAHARDCPLTCLQPLISTRAYNALLQECSTTGPHPTMGDAADLYNTGELATVRGIGTRSHGKIETTLTNAGFTAHTRPPPRPRSTPSCPQRPASPAACTPAR